jgi:hypothetical protein
MRRRMCFRCGSHLPTTDFDDSQKGNHSPWCKTCITWPVGQIPVRGMRYREYIDFKIQQALIKPNPRMVHPDQFKNNNEEVKK